MGKTPRRSSGGATGGIVETLSLSSDELVAWSRTPTAKRILWPLLFAAAVVLPLFRQTGLRSWQTMWAEDGYEYYSQARRFGGLHVLLRGYAGYLQLPPRVLAAVSTLVPIHDLSVYMALSSALVCALLAWFVYYASNGWISTQPVRLALASLVVLMPAMGWENTANITNTIWEFAAVAPWALISLGERPRDVVLRSAVVFFAATSTALSVLFLPLAIGYAIVRRTRATWIVAVTFCCGLLIQWAVVTHTANSSFSLFPKGTLESMFNTTVVRVFAMFLIGDKGIAATWIHIGQLLVIGSTIAICLILAVLWIGNERRRQILALVFVACSVISFVVPVRERQFYNVAFGQPYSSVGLRYSVIPVMLLASAIALLVAPPGRWATRKVARVGRPLFVLLVVVLIVTGFSVQNLRSQSPDWSASVSRAFNTYCKQASPNKLVLVKENPGGLILGVHVSNQTGALPVTLPCGDLSP